ncbi:transmembrane protein 260 isoform X2 [Polyodon spathula]|uniref:transmembrane protein 260 isoform X2 n=1 Tax=Polyodon spathula TaxID=7913 RepID=UPI001B7E6DEF|nr:transmembrane protein 260 isoform X2 [Polyodon spathula]
MHAVCVCVCVSVFACVCVCPLSQLLLTLTPAPGHPPRPSLRGTARILLTSARPRFEGITTRDTRTSLRLNFHEPSDTWICFITLTWLSGSVVAGIFAAGSFAVSRLAWQWSMAAEVFSLNNVFIGLLLSLSACFHTAGSAQQRDKFGCWGALCCGLSLCNQHTVLLYVLCIAPWVLGGLRTHKELSLPMVGRLGTCFLVGFLPYLYLPLSSFLNRARWSWGDQSSLGGLLTHLLRIEYGTFSLAKSETGTGMALMLRAQLTHCLSDLSAPVLVLSGAALLLNPLNRSRGSSRLVWLLAAMVTLYSLFFAWRANLDISKPLFLRVVERFWVQGDAVLCVLAGLGLSSLCCELDRRLGRGGVWRAAGWIFTAGFIASQAHRHSRLLDQSENFVVDRFARNILNSIPNGSIVLTRGDLPGNSLRYLHYCEELRGDLSLVEQEVSLYLHYCEELRGDLSLVEQEVSLYLHYCEELRGDLSLVEQEVSLYLHYCEELRGDLSLVEQEVSLYLHYCEELRGDLSLVEQEVSLYLHYCEELRGDLSLVEQEVSLYLHYCEELRGDLSLVEQEVSLYLHYCEELRGDLSLVEQEVSLYLHYCEELRGDLSLVEQEVSLYLHYCEELRGDLSLVEQEVSLYLHYCEELRGDLSLVEQEVSLYLHYCEELRGDLSLVEQEVSLYLHYCEELRGDLSLVEQEMMTYDWYVSKLGRHLPGVRFPGRLWDPVLSDQTFNLQRFLSENAGREVFACIGLPEGDRSWERGFSLWPWGVCEKLVPSGTPFYPAEWVRLTQNMYNWTEPYNSFQPGSWEEVANEEMWQSRMKTAFFLFDLAEKQSGSAEVQVQLYQLSYTVYQELVGREGEVEGERHPANWHKNLALASERLLRAGGGGVDSERLLSSSQLHFSLYLQREPGDPQAEAIRQAVQQLAKERERLQQQQTRGH